MCAKLQLDPFSHFDTVPTCGGHSPHKHNIMHTDSPEVNERFLDDFAVTVPDARRVAEILQLTFSADPHLRRGLTKVVTRAYSQLVQ